jgi:hypothetical protein
MVSCNEGCAVKSHCVCRWGGCSCSPSPPLPLSSDCSQMGLCHCLQTLRFCLYKWQQLHAVRSTQSPALSPLRTFPADAEGSTRLDTLLRDLARPTLCVPHTFRPHFMPVTVVDSRGCTCRVEPCAPRAHPPALALASLRCVCACDGGGVGVCVCGGGGLQPPADYDPGQDRAVLPAIGGPGARHL